MGTGEQARRPAAAAVLVQVLAAAGSVPGTPRTPTLVGSGTGTPPRTPRRGSKQGSEGTVRSGFPTHLLFAAGGLLLMLVGMLASQHGLRLSNVQALGVPAPRLSSSSFASTAQQLIGQDEAAVAAGSASGLLALLSSAAAAVGEQLGADGFTVRPELISAGGAQGAPSKSTNPASWQLRCAVVNNLQFHIDVMAGWTYAFQAAGCDVTVYQNERSLGIEDIMSTWLTGHFRKPELFPAEAGDYHVVILPTFRDQHAELIQYMLQLPRLKRQRYFLTQHNPDWLLNHPNVDILTQTLLAPLLAAARARDDAQQAEGKPSAAIASGEAGALSAEAPLLRVQVVTLASCVSNYTVHFLRQMAYNITEGHTYAERVGSFRVRADTGKGAGEDDSEALRRWIDTIDVEVPWMSPLVPWQDVDPEQQQQELKTRAGRHHVEQDTGSEGGTSGRLGADAAAVAVGPAETPALAPAETPLLVGASPLKPWMGHPPPPAPLGMEAIALLEELNMARGAKNTGPRHVCIQGKLENSRRNYSAAFEALSHPAIVAHLRASGERLLLLGHRSKWETVVVPEAVKPLVVVLESLPYKLFFDTLSRCRAIMLAFATNLYYSKKSSSTIATALNVGVPLVAERRTLEAYDFLNPNACFVYDDRVQNVKKRAAAEEEQSGKEDAGAGGHGKKGQRRLLLGKQEAGSGGSAKDTEPEGAAADEAAQEQATAVADPRTGSYSAAILLALRSESSLAARLAVRKLKEEVMSHNQVVAAAFMTGTEQQYSQEERQADAEWWGVREAERQPKVAAPAAADTGGTWPVQPMAGDGQ